MTKINPNLLNDTLKLVSLVRQTAIEKGQKSKAEKLTPVEMNLHHLATNARVEQKTVPLPSGSNLLFQDDFKTLLSAIQKPAIQQSPNERNQVVSAMASGGMTEIDIARNMGMTRDEVSLIISVLTNQSH